MKKILSTLAILLFPIICFSQDKIVGQFTTEMVSMVIGQQQTAQQGSWGSTINIARSYLTVNGKKYHLYRLSKEEIQALEVTTNGQQQQVQQPVAVIAQDYYLLGYQNENDKYCLIQGVIDEERRVIYNASLLRVYSNNEIIEALDKCGVKK